MRKFLNDPIRFVDEMLEGVLVAHPEALRAGPGIRTLVRADAPVTGKVAIATGGGSGHLPVFMGYVGRGLADGAAVGEVFSSPSSEQILDVTRAIDGGRGVIYLYGNYGGDVLNFDLAAELAALEGIEIASLRGADDVASAPASEAERRRGVAGIVFLYKIAGARADEGASLDEVVATVRSAASGLRSMGVALSPCIIPAAGRPTFTLEPGSMEIGMGIHGEPGVRRGVLGTADEIVDEIVEAIIADLPYRSGDEVAVLVNGLGATPKEELYLLYRRTHAILEAHGIRPVRVLVGEYATSLEMAGASISLLRVGDELLRLLDAPAASPFFVQP